MPYFTLLTLRLPRRKISRNWHPAYTQLNLLLPHIFYAIFKYWVKNNSSLNIKNWIFCKLKYWQLVYSHTKASFDLIDKFISKWLELN